MTSKYSAVPSACPSASECISVRTATGTFPGVEHRLVEFEAVLVFDSFTGRQFERDFIGTVGFAARRQSVGPNLDIADHHGFNRVCPRIVLAGFTGRARASSTEARRPASRTVGRSPAGVFQCRFRRVSDFMIVLSRYAVKCRLRVPSTGAIPAVRYRLARVSHELSAAEPYTSASAAFRFVGLLDVLSSTPPVPSVRAPCPDGVSDSSRRKPVRKAG